MSDPIVWMDTITTENIILREALERIENLNRRGRVAGDANRIARDALLRAGKGSVDTASSPVLDKPAPKPEESVTIEGIVRCAGCGAAKGWHNPGCPLEPECETCRYMHNDEECRAPAPCDIHLSAWAPKPAAKPECVHFWAMTPVLVCEKCGAHKPTAIPTWGGHETTPECWGEKPDDSLNDGSLDWLEARLSIYRAYTSQYQTEVERERRKLALEIYRRVKNDPTPKPEVRTCETCSTYSRKLPCKACTMTVSFADDCKIEGFSHWTPAANDGEGK